MAVCMEARKIHYSLKRLNRYHAFSRRVNSLVHYRNPNIAYTKHDRGP